MELNSKNLTYPILWIQSRERSMGVYKNLDELTTCTKGALKHDFFKNLKLISADEKVYLTKNAKKRCTKNPYSLSTFLWRIVGGELIQVSIAASEIKDHNLEIIRKEVLQILENEDRWDSDGNLDLLRKIVKSAKSIRELVMIIKRRYFLEPLEIIS